MLESGSFGGDGAGSEEGGRSVSAAADGGAGVGSRSGGEFAFGSGDSGLSRLTLNLEKVNLGGEERLESSPSMGGGGRVLRVLEVNTRRKE